MIYWPGSNIIKSQGNGFTAHERMEHSCMWSESGERLAKRLAERVTKISAEERKKAAIAFRKINLVGMSS